MVTHILAVTCVKLGCCWWEGLSYKPRFWVCTAISAFTGQLAMSSWSYTCRNQKVFLWEVACLYSNSLIPCDNECTARFKCKMTGGLSSSKFSWFRVFFPLSYIQHIWIYLKCYSFVLKSAQSTAGFRTWPSPSEQVTGLLSGLLDCYFLSRASFLHCFSALKVRRMAAI